MSQQSGRIQIDFTERLHTTMTLARAYKAACTDISSLELQDKARSIEEGVFNEASSKEDYIRLSQIALTNVQSPLNGLHHIDRLAASSSSSSTLPDKGQTIGPYESASYYRSGLFSTIFKCQDPSTGVVIALKLTDLSRMSPPHNSQREARILTKAKHTKVISLVSTFMQPGGQYILVFPFMPYDFEEALHQHILHPAGIRSHLYDLFSALSHIHSLGIIHRDVKPSNILLGSPSGPAYLADFGIAWIGGDIASEPADKKITDVGTTAYRPPELLFGHMKYDCSLDLWAAGCVVIEALTDGKKTLFDAGPLGSELSLIQSIFKTLGTPTNDTWQEANEFPDWGKMEFVNYPAKPWVEIVADVSDDARDLVSKLIRYQSRDRLEAIKVLEHKFFQTN